MKPGNPLTITREHKWDVVAIDPGKQAGIAYFEGERLVKAELVKNPLAHREKELARMVVCETPVIYPDSPVDPATMIKLAFTAGLLVGLFECSDLRVVDPRGWKGQRPKGVDNRYTMSLLDPIETSIVNASTTRGKLNNVIDAVGIGLWHLGRR